MVDFEKPDCAEGACTEHACKGFDGSVVGKVRVGGMDRVTYSQGVRTGKCRDTV